MSWAHMAIEYKPLPISSWWEWARHVCGSPWPEMFQEMLNIAEKTGKCGRPKDQNSLTDHFKYCDTHSLTSGTVWLYPKEFEEAYYSVNKSDEVDHYTVLVNLLKLMAVQYGEENVRLVATFTHY